jgi:predicted nucleic acid-binding Zn ribbon protein
MQRQYERSIAEILQEVIRTMKWTDRVNDARIVAMWGKVMGKNIETYTRKLYVRRKVLYVEIDSSSLRSELFYGKDKIWQNLNKELGEDYLTDVVIR